MQFLFQYIKNHRRFALALAILWTSLIFIGCSLPGSDLPKVKLFEHFDKLVHFTFFVGFFLFWFLYLPRFKYKVLVLIMISAVYGFAIEFYQLYFVLGRSFDVLDGVADTLGAIFCSIVTILPVIRGDKKV